MIALIDKQSSHIVQITEACSTYNENFIEVAVPDGLDYKFLKAYGA